MNVLVSSDFATVGQLAQAGVRRVGVGGAPDPVASTGFLAAAREIAEQVAFARLAGPVPLAAIDQLFSAK